MATLRGAQMTKLNAGTPPAPGFADGSVRVFCEEITLAGQATTDTIEVARLPKGAIPLYGVIETDTSLGTSTVAIGISGDTGKYRAAGTFTATDAPTLFGVAAAVGQSLAAEETVFISIGTAALPGAGTLRVMFFYAFD
jgi:hypothetical protein